MIYVTNGRFDGVYGGLKRRFEKEARHVHTGRWQGANVSTMPDMATYELLNVVIHFDLGGRESLDHWRAAVEPNLPWADDHFAERVSGEPLNPGVQWAKWPWGHSADKFRDKRGQFNHSYMERFWPRYAGLTPRGELAGDGFTAAPIRREPSLSQVLADPALRTRLGIRWSYGDLQDVVELLATEPTTRQAWIPLFFPEDTGRGDGGRKPCTLGYQFIMRDNRLHVYYPMRSCDFVRHFRDDVYLAIRLLLWVLDRCRELDPSWKEVTPGTYSMHMTSLHMFVNDYRQLFGGE